MKIPKTSLVLILFLTTKINSECNNMCASCGQKDSQDFCFICENSVWSDGACNSPTKDNCLYHSAAGCLTCQNGYILSKDDGSCVKNDNNPIPNCAVLWQMNTGTQEKPEIYYGCNVCNGSAPSSDMTQCNRELPDGCLWGGVDDMGQVTCVNCSSPGQMSILGTCGGAFASGCMIGNDKGQCIQCSQGYYMRFPGVCAAVATGGDDEKFSIDI